jgi:hypothetical protein
LAVNSKGVEKSPVFAQEIISFWSDGFSKFYGMNAYI